MHVHCITTKTEEIGEDIKDIVGYRSVIKVKVIKMLDLVHIINHYTKAFVKGTIR